MKNTMKYLSMAALALAGAVMTACTSDDNIAGNIAGNEQPATGDNIVTVTTTIGLAGDNSATTRALAINYDAKTLTKTFAEGDQVALLYDNESGATKRAVATAENISADGKTASFTFTMENPKADETVSYNYPASLVSESGYNFQIDTQDGTLDYVASKDFAQGGGQLSGTTLPASVTLENQFAIVAFTLKDGKGTDATTDDEDITSTITRMIITDGSNSYTINRSAAAGPIYVIMEYISGAKISIIATDGNNNYTKTLSGKIYRANNFYQQGLRMQKAVSLSITSPAVGQVIGSDGKNYNVGDVPTGVTAVAMIAYVDGSHGLALALADESGAMSWADANTAAALHKPVFSGGTWRLPSKDEWLAMFTAGGSDVYTYTALNAALAAAGDNSSKFKVDDTYWSATEYETDYLAWIMYFSSDGVYHNYTDESKEYLVRACLAF